MKILYFLIITIMVFSGIGLVFAQVTTYPPYENYGGYSDICTNADITDDFSSDVTPNYIRNTMVSYGGTNLITTIVPGTINSSQTMSLVNYGSFGQYALSNSTLFSVDSLKKISADGIYGVRNVTLGLTNIGNKTVTVVVVSGNTPASLVVVNAKSGATVNGVDDYDFASDKAVRGLDNMAILLHHGNYRDNTAVGSVNLIPIRLEPGESILRQSWHLEEIRDSNHGSDCALGCVYSTHHTSIDSGNYTMTAVSRFLAATDKGCTMVYLWSQPVNLTVLPKETVPEFPLTIPILLASVVSVILFYRMRFGK